METNRQDGKSAPPSRRDFLKSTSAVVAGGAWAGTMGVARNAHAAGSDEIKIGLIGCGGRGSDATRQALIASPTNRLVAMGDAFEDAVKYRYGLLKKAKPEQVDVPEVRQFVGLDAYKKVLETDCDLVILATPPGFRPIHFDAAIAAGKHVFMEKPVATDAAGVRQVLDTNKIAQEKKLAVQVGLHRRHEDRYRETIKRLQDGAIGDIYLTRVYWNGSTPWVRPRAEIEKVFGRQITEMEYQVRNWYFFNWLSGDHIVEQHIHNLDVINWLKGGYPVQGNGMGGRQARTGIDHGEIFDHHFVEFTYADGSKMYSQCRHMGGCARYVGEHAHGTKGTANIGAGTIFDVAGNKTWNFGRGGGGGHQKEHDDLFLDLREGKVPNEGEYGALSTMTAIFGRMLTYSGLDISWDAALNSKVTLGAKDFLAFDETPPVVPDENGLYKIAIPGEIKVV